MRALVTRPREDAQGIAAALAERGLEVTIEPLMEIVRLAGVAVPLDGAQGILATSANGVRALAAATPERGLPVYAVGDATGRVAREHGFATVHCAGGDVHSLADLVRRRVRPEGGALVHAAGTVLAGDLAGMLGADGYEVRRVVLYEARTQSEAGPGLVAALSGKAIDLALFFSPRTAATFATLVTRAGLGQECRHIAAFCLSAAVARQLEALPWRAVHVAASPEQAALLAEIDRTLGKA